MRKLTFSAPVELLDALSGALFSAGAQGLEEGAGTLTAYVANDQEAETLIAVIQSFNAADPPPSSPLEVTTQDIDDSWQDAWQQALTAVELTDRWVLRPTHQAPAPPGEATLWFQPQASFGDGSHPTTQLAARGMAKWLSERAKHANQAFRMLDFGTGNGVLSLLFIMESRRYGLQPTRLLAVDIDEVAIESFRQNLKLNDLDAPELELQLGPLRAEDDEFELIVANINTPVLMEHADQLARCLAPHGTLLLTGLLVEDEPALSAAYRQHGLDHTSSHRQGEWSLLSFSQRS